MENKYFESLYPPESRDRELSEIVGYIREGNSSQIIGIPGVGRTNLLGLLAYNREVRLRHFPTRHGIVHFVMVNFSEVKYRTFPDVVKFLFLCLGNSLRERSMTKEYEKVDNAFKNALSYNDELVIAQELKNAIDFLAIGKKLTIIFLFDRFDDYTPHVSEDFFTLLRSLRDRAKYRFSAVFSLSHPLDDMADSEVVADFSDFIRGHEIYLSLYDKASIDFRISYLEKITAKTLPEGIKKETKLLTGGHMRLMKVCSEALLAQGEVKDFPPFLLGQKAVLSALVSIWKTFTPSEQACLSDLAIKQSCDEEIDYLLRVGIREGDKIAIPLVKEAIAQGLLAKSDEKFVFDVTTNTIKKGEMVVSDILSKGEYRLFSYLLSRQNEIIEREAIVDHVWGEEKSTAGVTEQAIDQLLFRLRRKIEDDPDNPQHLHIIKGRGVRFSQ
ncbi:MAG: winged helix-turn-helix domain-containing protein [Candidatus Levybacteria bacterium]|nr:winged helix-turn-helix domain-containing protein [Candidatus Levybacteria bacterium]